MKDDSADLIQSWFARHDGDGDFQCGKRVFPAFAEVVGPRCAAILERGEKMEIEAVVSAKKAAAAWQAVLTGISRRTSTRAKQ